MISEKFEDLMWEDIDGVITAEDRTRLEQFLRTNPDAMRHFEELRYFTSRFGGIVDVEPPPELRARIDASLDPDRFHRRQPAGSSSVFHAIRSFFKSSWGIRYASAAALGVFVGVVGYAAMRGGLGETPDVRDLRGSMMIMPAESETVNIDTHGVKGLIGVTRDSDVVVSVVELGASDEVEVVLRYPGDFIGTSVIAEHTHHTHHVDVREDGVHVTTNGKAKTLAYFKPAGAEEALFVRVTAGGALVFEGRVRPEGQ